MLNTVIADTANYIIDAIFLLDLIFNFRTTYFNSKTGDEIISPKRIAKRYLKNLFFVDLLSTMPLDLIISLTVSELDASSEKTL